jgi:hypothetical protein
LYKFKFERMRKKASIGPVEKQSRPSEFEVERIGEFLAHQTFINSTQLSEENRPGAPSLSRSDRMGSGLYFSNSAVSLISPPLTFSLRSHGL